MTGRTPGPPPVPDPLNWPLGPPPGEDWPVGEVAHFRAHRAPVSTRYSGCYRRKARWKIYSPPHIQRYPVFQITPRLLPVIYHGALSRKINSQFTRWHKPDIPREFQGFSPNLYSHLPHWADSDGRVP